MDSPNYLVLTFEPAGKERGKHRESYRLWFDAGPVLACVWLHTEPVNQLWALCHLRMSRSQADGEAELVTDRKRIRHQCAGKALAKKAVSKSLQYRRSFDELKYIKPPNLLKATFGVLLRQTSQRHFCFIFFSDGWNNAQGSWTFFFFFDKCFPCAQCSTVKCHWNEIYECNSNN